VYEVENLQHSELQADEQIHLMDGMMHSDISCEYEVGWYQIFMQNLDVSQDI
jgi:hypothetical protein